MFRFQYQYIFFIKNQHVPRRLCTTDTDSLVSISLYFFKKNIEIDSFNSWGITDRILGAINEIDSVPYVTILGFLLYNSLLSLR